jgi:hypothetical protein
MGASRAVAIVIVALFAAGCGVARAVVVDHAADARLAGDVWQALQKKSPDTVTLIDVDAVDGTVYLTGRVDTAGQKIFAEAAVWRVDGVRQVVNDIQAAEDGAAVAALAAASVRHPVLEHLPRVARIEQVAGGPASAYDAKGRLVATVYTVPVRELTGRGLEDLRASQAIDHVSIYLATSHPDVPLPHYHVVLWHVSASEAAALR